MANSPFIKQDYKGILDASEPRRSFPHFPLIAMGVAALTGGILFTTLAVDAQPGKINIENIELASFSPVSNDAVQVPEPSVKLMQLSLPNQDAADAAEAVEATETSVALLSSESEASLPDAVTGLDEATELATEATDTTQSLPNSAGTWKEATVRSGDSMALIFQRLGLSASELHYIVKSDEAAAALKRIYPGQELNFRVSEDNRVLELRFQKDRLNSLQILASADNTYTAQEVARDPERKTANAASVINDSLFLSAQQAGLSDNVTMELANIFGWDIDFALDIRQGDRFSVLYEDLYLDGEKIGHGNILAAKFVNQGRVYQAVRYTTPDGE